MTRTLLTVAVCAWALPAQAQQFGAFNELKGLAGEAAVVPAVAKITEVRTTAIQIPANLYIPEGRPVPQWPGKPCPEPLCTGDQVATDGGYLGRVAGIFPDGRVSVQINGFSQNGTFQRSQVAATWGCNSESCVGDPVVTESGYAGTFIGIFPDGRLSVRIPGYDRFGTYGDNQVAGIRACSGGLCFGAATVTNTGHLGTVMGVFRDRRVSVKVPGYDRYGTYERSRVAITAGCGEGLCVGATVATESGYTGTVRGIFPDGRFAVALRGYDLLYSYTRSQLASQNCL